MCGIVKNEFVDVATPSLLHLHLYTRKQRINKTAMLFKFTEMLCDKNVYMYCYR